MSFKQCTKLANRMIAKSYSWLAKQYKVNNKNVTGFEKASFHAHRHTFHHHVINHTITNN